MSYATYTFGIIIATFGEQKWAEAAWTQAYASCVPFEKSYGESVKVTVLHEPDATLAEVRNKAARENNCCWQCFLDADDRLAPNFLDVIFDYIYHYDAPPLSPEAVARQLHPWSLLVPAVQYVAPGAHGAPTKQASIPNWGRSLIEVNCAVIGTVHRHELFDHVGGFREFPMYEDWDLWLRCIIAGAPLQPCEDAIYIAMRNNGRNTQPALAEETYWRIRNEHEVAFRNATMLADISC